MDRSVSVVITTMSLSVFKLTHIINGQKVVASGPTR